MSRVDQVKSRRLRIGTVSAASHVLFVSWPAFCHCSWNPVAVGGRTERIWSSMTECAYDTLSTARPKNSMSAPTSVSVLISGLRSLLPNVAGLSVPPVPIVNVSYCAANDGRCPVVPREKRSLNRLSCSAQGHHGSGEAIHAAERRPKVAQRLPSPKSELPSRRITPPRM